MTRIALLFFIIILLSTQIKAQLLIVGLTPGEQIDITGTTVSYDTVWVTGTGTLNITNANFTSNYLLIVDSTARLNVHSSQFTMNGTGIFYGNSESTLKGNLAFAGNINVGGNAKFTIDSANVDYPMFYVGQYKLIGFGNAIFTISNSNFQLGTGKFGGGFIGNAVFHQSNTNYHSTLGIVITTGVNQGSSFISENCTGGFELIIADSCNIALENTPSLILWFCFGLNDSANFAFPPSNSLMQYASNVTGFNFSDTVPGISGIDYHVNVQNSDTVFWCIFQGKGSDITINNSTLLACGERFMADENAVLQNFTNDSTYTSYNAPLTGRSLELANTSLFAWNFYSLDSASILIKECLFGEVLVFGNGTARVENSICDGNGGYVGAYDNGKLYLRNSAIIRSYTGPAILLSDNNSYIEFVESSVTGDIIVNGNSKLLFGNTLYNTEPVVNNAAFFVNSFINEQDTIGLQASVAGTLKGENGPLGTTSVIRYKTEYSFPDSTGKTLILDTLCTPVIQNSTLCSWNTQGITPGNYLLWLTLYLNNDSSLTVNRPVYVDNLGNASYIGQEPRLSVYPNPSNGLFTIESDENVEIRVVNALGKVVFTGIIPGSTTIDLTNQPAGIYIVIVKSEKQAHSFPLIIEK